MIPEEIAALRPMLDTRPHMIPSYDDPRIADKHESMRGNDQQDRKAMFNDALRSGHAWRSAGDE